MPPMAPKPKASDPGPARYADAVGFFSMPMPMAAAAIVTIAPPQTALAIGGLCSKSKEILLALSITRLCSAK